MRQSQPTRLPPRTDDGAPRYQPVARLHSEPYARSRRNEQVDLGAEADGPDSLAKPQLIAFGHERHDPADQARGDLHDRDLQVPGSDDRRHPLIGPNHLRVPERPEGAVHPFG